MKCKIFVIAILAIVTVFGGCKKDKAPEKSKACDIVSFKVGDQTWNISGTNITYTYPKGTNVSNLSPTIIVSDKATVNPKSGVAQDFSNEKLVTYTVTAEDGKTSKTYNARAVVSTTL
jgi:hypothetical protein